MRKFDLPFMSGGKREEALDGGMTPAVGRIAPHNKDARRRSDEGVWGNQRLG